MSSIFFLRFASHCFALLCCEEKQKTFIHSYIHVSYRLVECVFSDCVLLFLSFFFPFADLFFGTMPLFIPFTAPYAICFRGNSLYLNGHRFYIFAAGAGVASGCVIYPKRLHRNIATANETTILNKMDGHVYFVYTHKMDALTKSFQKTKILNLIVHTCFIFV